MKTIRWLRGAEEDLRRLHAFIEPHSPAAAAKAVQTILERVGLLVEFPETGRPWDPDSNYRELIVPFGARGYVIRYRIHQDNVIIAQIWHGLEDRAPE